MLSTSSDRASDLFVRFRDDRVSWASQGVILRVLRPSVRKSVVRATGLERSRPVTVGPRRPAVHLFSYSPNHVERGHLDTHELSIEGTEVRPSRAEATRRFVPGQRLTTGPAWSRPTGWPRAVYELGMPD